MAGSGPVRIGHVQMKLLTRVGNYTFQGLAGVKTQYDSGFALIVKRLLAGVAVVCVSSIGAGSINFSG